MNGTLTEAKDIDLLINNAGVAAFSGILDEPRDLVEGDMRSNYFGTLDVVRAFYNGSGAEKVAGNH